MISLSPDSFDKDPRPTLVLDAAGQNVLAANHAASDWADVPQGRLVSIQPADYPEKVKDALRAAQNTAGLPPNMHLWDVVFDGQNARLLTVLLDTPGEITDARPVDGVEAASFNGTPEFTAGLRKSSELIEHAGNIAKVGGWEYDPKTDVVTRTPVVAKIVGSPGQLYVKMSEANRLYPRDYHEKFTEIWTACVRDGVAFEEVMELLIPENGRVWVRVSGAPVWNDDKTEIVSIRGALQDITELVTARQERAELSRKLEEALEAITDSFMIIDRNWNVTFANKVAEDLMSTSRDQMLGKNLWELFPESKNSEFHKRYQQLFNDGKTQHFVARSIRSKKWLSVSAFSTTHGIAITSRDITEEHARDEQLRLLETAVARLNDIVMIAEVGSESGTDLPKFVFANDALERIMGFTPKEMIGKTANALRGTETQVSEISKLQAALESNSETRSQIINYTKDGDQIWLDLDVVPIKRDDGRVTHWVSVSRDITEAKHTEERVALSEERFRLIAGATNDVIWDCDLISGVMWWNDKLATVFGHDPGQFEDRLTWWDANIHPDEQHDVLKRMQDIIDSKDEFWKLEYRFRRADGTFAHVRDHGAILRDGNGTATRILGNMTDVTEQRRLEEQLLQSQKMEAIGKLTGGVAHDFNNLLAVIMGNLELLRAEVATTRKLPPDANDLIQAGISAVERGSNLTRQMLSYARKARLDSVPTDINAVVLETASWVSRTVDANIEIKTQLDAALGKTLLDPNTLQNSLVNLLLNARDAMKSGGKILIETRHLRPDDPFVMANDLPLNQRGYAMLSVSDTGDGIPQEQLQRVCDPFFTTKPVGQGSGLGLSMVQGFVRQSGGDLRIFSEPGLGTTVTLFFSAKSPGEALENPPEQQHTPQRSASATPSKKPVILLAEDDPAVAKVLVRTLRESGFDVSPVDSGDAAYLAFQKKPQVDLLLTDVSMPGRLNGQALAEACWKIREDLPVLFFTGHPHDAAPSGALASHACLRLTKPVSRTALLDAINALLPVKDRAR